MKNNRDDRAKKRKNRKFAGSMQVISILLLFICGFLGFQIIGNKQQIKAYSEEESQINEQIAQEQEKQQEIEAESEYMNSDEYIEELAREKLGLLFDNEIIFKKQGR